MRRPRLRPNMGRLKTPRARPAPGLAGESESGDWTLVICRDPAEIDAARWNALLARQPSATPFVSIEYLRALHASAQRRRRHRLGAALPAARGGRRARRRLPALSQGPLLRRVRVRLGLGRRLPAPRPRLLPQAHRRDPVHAGAGAAPAGDDARAAAAAAARHRGDRARGRPLLGAPPVPRRRRPGRGGRGRLVDAQHGPVPLAQPRARALCRLRRLPRQPAAREAQEDPAGTAPRRRCRRHASPRPSAAPSAPTTGLSSTAATPSPTGRTTPRPT